MFFSKLCLEATLSCFARVLVVRERCLVALGIAMLDSVLFMHGIILGLQNHTTSVAFI